MDTAPAGASSEEQRTFLLHRIQESLAKAQLQASRLKRLDTRLMLTSLLMSGLATLVAGLTAAAGPLAGEGTPAWRLTCGVVAGMTALAGLLSGAHKQFNISDRRARALACVGQLSALELALTVTRRDLPEIAREFEEISANYQDFLI